MVIFRINYYNIFSHGMGDLGYHTNFYPSSSSPKSHYLMQAILSSFVNDPNSLSQHTKQY